MAFGILGFIGCIFLFFGILLWIAIAVVSKIGLFAKGREKWVDKDGARLIQWYISLLSQISLIICASVFTLIGVIFSVILLVSRLGA